MKKAHTTIAKKPLLITLGVFSSLVVIAVIASALIDTRSTTDTKADSQKKIAELQQKLKQTEASDRESVDEINRELAGEYVDQQNYDDAYAAYQAALASNTTVSEGLLVSLAVSAEAAEKYPEAIQYYKQLIERTTDKESIESYQNRIDAITEILTNNTTPPPGESSSQETEQ